MIIFLSTKQFDKKFEELNKFDQNRILEKLKSLSLHPNIFTVIKKLNDFKEATHRLRIGNLRIVLKLISENQNQITFSLIKLGHRREIYK